MKTRYIFDSSLMDKSLFRTGILYPYCQNTLSLPAMAAIQKFINQIFIFPVRLYQWILSPFLGRNCRFQPTCSHYMIGAIEEWGPIKGIYLGAKRIGRCHPWGGHGYDPVPVNEKRQKASKHFTITKPEADTSIHKHGEETEEK